MPTPAVTSAYGNRPASLKMDPNPPAMPAPQGSMNPADAAIDQTMKTVNGQAPMTADPNAAPAQAQDPIDAALNQIDPVDSALNAFGQPPAQQGQQPQNEDQQLGSQFAPQPNDQYAPEPGFLKAQIDQFKGLTTRFQAGMAANDTEVMGLLKNKFGAENVRWKDGKAFYREDGKGAFKPLDPKQFEIFSDLIPDMGRAFVQEAVAAPAEALGGAAGFVGGLATMGAGSGPMAAAGAYAARIASAPAQIKIADGLAEMVGVPHDKNRDFLVESVIQGGLEAAAPVVGKLLTRSTGFVSKYIPGTAARAVRLANKEADNVFVLSAKDKLIQQDALDLAESGLVQKIPGDQVGFPQADVVLSLTQLHPDHPVAQAAEKQLANNGRYQNAMRLHAEQWGEAVKDHIGSIVQLAKNEGADLTEKEVAEAPLGKTLVDAAQTFRDSEGKAIEQYKRMAVVNSKNARVPLTQDTRTQLADIAKGLGFKMRVDQEAGKITMLPPENVNDILGNFGINDAGHARALVNVVDTLIKKSENGQGLKMSDINGVTNLVGSMNTTTRRAGGEIAGKWGQFTGSLREYKNQSIMQYLPDQVTKDAFAQTNAKYGALREGVISLSDTINSDMSRQAVVKNLFNKGKENLGDVKAIKSLLATAAPEQWEKLKGEWVEQLVLQHTNKGPVGLNAGAMLKDVQQRYGKEFLDVLYDGTGNKSEDLFKMLRVGDRLNQIKRPASQMPDAEKKNLIMDVGRTILASPYVAFNGALSMLGIAKGKDSVLMDILTQDGVDKYITAMPKRDRIVVSQKFKQLVNYARANGMLSKVDQGLSLVPSSARIRGNQLRDVSERVLKQQTKTNTSQSIQGTTGITAEDNQE